jgi:hypothetical protein
MASLNASGVPVVAKQYAGFRSYGRNIAITTNLNLHGQNSVRSATISGVPASERVAADFGTQSTPATESFLRQGGHVKHAESVGDTTTATILGTVPPASGSQPEIALLDVTTKRDDHRGNRIGEQETAGDTLLRRIENTSTRPGGEI